MLAKSNGFLGTNGRVQRVHDWGDSVLGHSRLHGLHRCWGIVLGELPIWNAPIWNGKNDMFLVFILRSSSISSVSDALCSSKSQGYYVGGCGKVPSPCPWISFHQVPILVLTPGFWGVDSPPSMTIDPQQNANH